VTLPLHHSRLQIGTMVWLLRPVANKGLNKTLRFSLILFEKFACPHATSRAILFSYKLGG
jgi:hypothetical protein